MAKRFYTISMFRAVETKRYARSVPRNLRLLLVFAILASAGCQSDPKTRAKETAEADDFWPDAPKPTVTKGTRTFHYQPANVGRYRMVADGGSTAGPAAMTFKMTFDLDFRPGPTPIERNAHIVATTIAARSTNRVFAPSSTPT
jgi:hypothetical protein